MIEVTEEDMKMLEWGEKNDQWIKENHYELKQKYPDMWVAIHDGKVLTSAEDFDKVLNTVKTKHQDIKPYLVIRKIRTEPLFTIPSFTF